MKFKPSLRSGKSFRTPTKLDFLKKPPDRGLIAPDFMPVKPVTADAVARLTIARSGRRSK